MFNKGCEFYQPKVNISRVCFLPEQALSYSPKIKDDIKEIYERDSVDGKEILLYPYTKSSLDKWIKLLNNNLMPFAKKHGLRLKSHSFRISFVTRILRHSSVDRAQSFIGHKDIRSTMAYSRYKVGDKKSLQVLDKAFESEE